MYGERYTKSADQALSIPPTTTTTLYVAVLIAWCGAEAQQSALCLLLPHQANPRTA
jgi:hypothetical protein